MATKKFQLTVKLPSGKLQKLVIDADSPGRAKEMAEAQYGKGCVTTFPSQIK